MLEFINKLTPCHVAGRGAAKVISSQVRYYSSFATRVSYLTFIGLPICLPPRVTPNDIAVGCLVVCIVLVAMIKTRICQSLWSQTKEKTRR
jgi:hypothetical protein